MAKRKITEKKLDATFAKHIKEKRNWQCERCGFRELPPTVRIQLSHFHSRVARSVRYDEDNADVLCASCHRTFETKKTAEYYEWKKKKLGTRKFNALLKRYYTLKPGGFTKAEKEEMMKKFNKKL